MYVYVAIIILFFLYINFVMDPAPQVEHDATFDDTEYKPGVHRSHVDAPALVPVFVMDPAPHV